MRRRERKLEIAERKRKILYIIGRKLKKHQMKGWRSESSWFFPLPPFQLTHSLSFLPINWNMLPLHFCIPLSVLCLTYHDFACVLPHHAGRQMLHTDTHTHIKVTVLSLEFTFTPSHARIRSQYTQICACKGTHMQRYKWRQSEVRRRITVVHQDQSSCLLNWQEEIDYYTLWLMIQNECVCVRACMWVI